MTREDAEKAGLERQERFIDRYEKMVNDMREFIKASGIDAEELRKNKALSYLLYLQWRGDPNRDHDADFLIGHDVGLESLISLARTGHLPSPESVTRILRLLTSKTLEGEQIEELARDVFAEAKEANEDWGDIVPFSRLREHYHDLGPRPKVPTFGIDVIGKAESRIPKKYRAGPREDR